MTIKESIDRIQLESPHHGPIVAAEVTRLEARLESAERVVEEQDRKIAAAIIEWRSRTAEIAAMKLAIPNYGGPCHLGSCNHLAAHSAAKEPKP